MAVMEAREAVKLSGQPGPLQKAAPAPGAITVRAPMDGGGTIALEMSPREANALACGVFDALGGRGM